jgi:hypothetical protein
MRQGKQAGGPFYQESPAGAIHPQRMARARDALRAIRLHLHRACHQTKAAETLSPPPAQV